MNKKLNTALFFVGATILNVVLVLVIAVALLVPYALFVAPQVSGAMNVGALVLIVIAATLGSFPVYRWIIQEFQKRVDLEKYFDPIVKQSSDKKLR